METPTAAPDQGEATSLPQISRRTIGEAWLAIGARILEAGIDGVYEGRAMREILLVTVHVTEPSSDDPVIERFADHERLTWMNSNFTNSEPVPELGGAESYAARLRDYASSGLDQVQWVIERLRLNPTSRSATITTFQPLSDTTYTPCVSMLDFFLVAGSLQLAVYAHSIDFGTKGYGNLVELARLQEEVSRGLGVGVGSLTMLIKSAHVYATDVPYVARIVTAERGG
jgi:thymidylate synthase